MELSIPNVLSTCRKYNLCWNFDTTESKWSDHVSLMSIVVPRYLKWSTRSISLPPMITGEYDCSDFLKSKMSSFVFVVFNRKLFYSHRITQWFIWAMYDDSSLSVTNLRIAVSSAYFRTYQLFTNDTRPFVYKMNSNALKNTALWWSSVYNDVRRCSTANTNFLMSVSDKVQNKFTQHWWYSDIEQLSNKQMRLYGVERRWEVKE
jgi:hypothetical protein